MKKIIIANWKMYVGARESVALAVSAARRM